MLPANGSYKAGDVLSFIVNASEGLLVNGSPRLALDVGGSTAWLAGHANPEELAGFLAFCGCEAVVLDEAECPPPTGWKRAKTHSVFGLAPGCQLPLPEADAALWQSLAKNTEPAAGKAADLLFPDRPSKRDDFY